MILMIAGTAMGEGMTPVVLETNMNGTIAEGVDARDGTVTISRPGEYLLSGEMEQGQIFVNCQDDGKVTLYLNGVKVHNEQGPALIVAKWPEYDERLDYPTEEQHMESVMLAIRTIRNRRSEMNVPPSKKADLYVVTDHTGIFEEGAPFITRLAYAERVIVLKEEPADHERMAQAVTPDAKLYLPLAQLVDVDKELARIEKELENARREISRAEPLENLS